MRLRRSPAQPHSNSAVCPLRVADDRHALLLHILLGSVVSSGNGALENVSKTGFGRLSRHGARLARAWAALPINCGDHEVPETFLVPRCVAQYSGVLRHVLCDDTEKVRAASGRAGSLLDNVRRPECKAA